MSLIPALPTAVLAICLGLFLLPLLLPWWKWLAGSVVVFVAISIAIRLEHLYATSRPDYTGSPGEHIGLLFFVLLEISFALGLGLRFALVGILSMANERRYGDLKPLLESAKLWWRRRGPLPIGFGFKIVLIGVFAIIAAAILVCELVTVWGQYPSSHWLAISWSPSIDWRLAFVLDGLMSALVPAIVVALPLGLFFCDAPIRWSLSCSIPSAALVLAISWANRLDAGSVWWVTWIKVAMFLAVFSVCAGVSARIRHAYRPN
jgi:hypothetical protein